MTDPEHSGQRAQVRGARFRERVLDATIACITEAGVDNVGFADVARKAGVNGVSLYRRWKTVPRLLIDALLTRTQAEVPIPDTGSVHRDLEIFATELTKFAQTPIGTALIRFTVVSADSPEVDVSRREFWMQRLTAAEEIIERGKNRGEVDSSTDSRLVVLTLGGLVHIYVTHLGTDIPTSLPHQAVSLILSGVTSGVTQARTNAQMG
ncbi:transcriptional regulator (plasmid) [Rhodococcus erythropolis]|uniref:HTH-type transcriptional regulator AqdR n=1 Tax=Rhodococcus erythropolis TaxID=1833 RepID=AQDR_RHOER|nr:HTH-type transcriptional regulator AqdR [Rhodococcus erythropolis]A0A0E4AFE3.1 RecName: Full=HTH-type transcriptional regulator AqdR [Rhodococcus erythropolis]AKE01139.1 transcriptional regulator [Rhodococcus erythropolis]